MMMFIIIIKSSRCTDVEIEEDCAIPSHRCLKENEVDDDVHHYNQIHVTLRTNVSGNVADNSEEQHYRSAAVH